MIYVPNGVTLPSSAHASSRSEVGSLGTSEPGALTTEYACRFASVSARARRHCQLF